MKKTMLQFILFQFGNISYNLFIVHFNNVPNHHFTAYIVLCRLVPLKRTMAQSIIMCENTMLLFDKLIPRFIQIATNIKYFYVAIIISENNCRISDSNKCTELGNGFEETLQK